jgi:hypothetical protein
MADGLRMFRQLIVDLLGCLVVISLDPEERVGLSRLTSANTHDTNKAISIAVGIAARVRRERERRRAISHGSHRLGGDRCRENDTSGN